MRPIRLAGKREVSFIEAPRKTRLAGREQREDVRADLRAPARRARSRPGSPGQQRERRGFARMLRGNRDHTPGSPGQQREARSSANKPARREQRESEPPAPRRLRGGLRDDAQPGSSGQQRAPSQGKESVLQTPEQTRRYIWKLYPTASQAAILHEQRKMMADLWNALKQRHEDVYRREGKVLSYFDLTKEITELRHECPEWAIIPSLTAYRVARWLTLSYQAFFRRVKAGETPGYPGWRRRERATTIPLGTMDKTGWHLEQCENPFSWRLHYKSVTDVKDRGSWLHARGRLPGSPGQQREVVGRPVQAPVSQGRRRQLASHGFPVSAWRNADIIWRDGNWWLSVCMDIAPRRSAGRFPVTIAFDLLDDLATVNGVAETPGELLDAQALQDDVDRLKSERDTRWPRAKKIPDDQRDALVAANAEISELSAAVARKRRNALHVWTARIIARASDITVMAPPLREVVRSPRGNDKQWGANIGIVSELNRHLLAQAPGSAIQMLRYKAAETGVRCDVVTDKTPEIAVGGELVTAGKTLRRARREARRAA